MVVRIDTDLFLLVLLGFVVGALLKPLLLWFGLKNLGKYAGPEGVGLGGLTAVALVALQSIGTIHVEEYRAVLLALLLGLLAAVAAIAIRRTQPLPPGEGGKGGGGGEILGNHGRIVGGRGGRGRVPGSKGGDGGSGGRIVGDHGLIIGGDGGNAAQWDGRGGRATRSPAEVAGMPSFAWGFGRGGWGANAPEYDRRLAIMIRICDEYMEKFPNDAQYIRAGIDRVPVAWVNTRLSEINEIWRVDQGAEGFILPPLTSKP